MSTADPHQPETPGESGATGSSVRPGTPAAPGARGTSGTPAASGQPGTPSASGVPGTPGQAPEQPSPSRWKFGDGVPPVWLRRVTIGAGVVIVLVLLGVLGSIVLPGWWAGVVTGLVQGVSSAGILVGLVCGLVFTVIPASVIWLAVRSTWTWRTRLIVAASAAVVALPNVLTLVIDVGTTSSAVDARLDMVIGSPSFTGSTLVGVIIGLIAVVGGVLGWRWLRRSRAELRKVRGAQGKKSRGRSRASRSETDTTASG
ncbi:collagen-like protein [Ruania zhangjianzhongii]|uniref:collagen-like triple helix repeat-containing protein n=1 Tax=Ruania zhangjianzhongii TaxID=2603206 RepID=UPI0011C7A148|nr:collagen-like protein [Ruania zhangjianzhongii]